MKIRSILILSLILVVVGCNACWADVVEPGTKEVTLYYQLSNINDYPDYVFLLHGVPFPTYEIINNTKFSFYKLSEASIYAVKKSDFNQAELEKMDESQINNLFENDTRFIKSNIQLSGSYGTVAQTNPLESAIMVLEIESINQNQLNINKKQMKYYFSDGSTETRDFKTQNQIPQPESNPYTPILLYIVIPLIVLGIIIIIILKKR